MFWSPIVPSARLIEKLWNNGVISRETALAYATNPTNLSLRLTEEPESAMKKEDGSTYYQLGHCHYRLGHLQASAEALRKAVRLLPDFATAQVLLGHVLHEAGDDAAAVVPLRHAVNLDPGDDQAKKLLKEVEERLRQPRKP